MAKTREPTLADVFLSTRLIKELQPNGKEGQRIFNNVQQKIRMAEKFVLDNEASERVAVTIRDVPELLAEQIQFARPPFDLCWIEYDSQAIYKTLSPDGVITENSDKRVGILIDHNRMTIIAETINNRTGIMPFRYHLNTEWLLEDQLAFCDQMKISRLGIDFWLWGSVTNKFIAEGKDDYLRVLRDTNMVETLLTGELSDSQTDKIMSSTTGDFKNHIAMLLMINRPSLTQHVRVPSMRGWIRSKPRPFMAYNAVRMALDPVPIIRKLSEGSGDGDLRRRHRVRGHYCHNDAARKALLRHSCVHDWHPANDKWEPIKPNVGDDVEHWICLSSCGGRRWWREQHERGSAGIGYVDHTQYKVEA
jgi:hypothetical protein